MKVVQLIGLVVLLNGCLFTDSSVENNGAPQSNIENNGESTCGNGEIDAGEACDLKNLNGADCNSEMQGTFGELSCNNQCEFDLDSCLPIPATCGDGTFDKEIEECDGTELGGATCETEVGEGSEGALGCSPNCTLDRSGCGASCGNSAIEEGEECEAGMIELGCAALVGTGSTGNVRCNACGYDISDCTPVYKQISAGGAHTCALKYDGTVRCWGAGDGTTVGPLQQGQSIVPIGTRFDSISSGGLHTCGIDLIGNVFCWGWNNNGQSRDQSGDFVQISAGVFHTCGLLKIGRTVCWGDSLRSTGISDIDDVDLIGSGRLRTCYLIGTRVSCTAANGNYTSITGSYSSINPGGGAIMCGTSETATSIPCWGNTFDDDGETYSTNPDRLPFGGFKSVDAGRYHACGIDQSNLVSCWGRPVSFRDLPVGVEFREISVGDFHACGLTQSGEAHCWGENNFGQTLAPLLADRFTGVDEEL